MIITVDKIFNDKIIKLLLGSSAYFFLLALLTKTQDISPLSIQIAFLASICLLLLRMLYIIVTKKNVPEIGQRFNMISNTLIFAAYWFLIAEILGSDSKFIWIIYALIFIRLLISTVSITLYSFKKKI